MTLFESSNPHYQFNKKTLKYERVKRSWWYHLRSFFGFVLLSALFGVGFFFLYLYTFQSPEEKRLAEENEAIATQYKLLSRQLDEALDVMQNIRERDDNFYRVMLEADSIPSSLRTGNYDATARYAQWEDLRTSQIVRSTTQKMDILERMLYVQSNSFDELVDLSKKSEDRLKHIPAIMPVLNKDLKRTASGYGRRVDPIYKTVRFHKGMDFSAPTGTEIFVTADGVITSIGWKQGYGNCIFVDHGYGYVTVYGHISKFVKGMKKGTKVVRGDVIAYVGSTGKSTGPHLHYEVRYKGVHQNPQNYYYLDLSPEEYDQMVLLSANNAKTFD
ncbi:MAG: M23 family metallopeptidase [Paludibacteraceae bacterium]|nr:M23 family metallopeptidase [Paludibacteraceae bacterium]